MRELCWLRSLLQDTELTLSLSLPDNGYQLVRVVQITSPVLQHPALAFHPVELQDAQTTVLLRLVPQLCLSAVYLLISGKSLCVNIAVNSLASLPSSTAL